MCGCLGCTGECTAMMQVRLRKLEEALEYIVSREDFSFAECSEAEEIWKRAKEALAV